MLPFLGLDSNQERLLQSRLEAGNAREILPNGIIGVNISSSLCLCVCVCLCERETERERVRGRTIGHIHICRRVGGIEGKLNASSTVMANLFGTVLKAHA